MKLRIKSNSIRYRLTKTDVANLSKNGVLDEKTEFPGGPIFHYRLQSNSGIDNLEAAYEKDTITIYVPERIVKEWASSEIIGSDHTLDLPNGRKLLLLIEKDFVCLDHTLEDQSDNYENPNKVC
jgi:hypothetical protein